MGDGVLDHHAGNSHPNPTEETAPLSPVKVLDQIKHSRMRLLQGCRASLLIEMKQAQEERELMQLKVCEMTGLKTHLMNAKVEEIINEVVAPERERALEETDAVTRSTLCDATLPSQVVQPAYQLTEEEQELVNNLAGGLKREQLEASSTELAAQESRLAEDVNEKAREAVIWATERQLLAGGRNLLHQKRLQMGVSKAVSQAEDCRLTGETVKCLVLAEKQTEALNAAIDVQSSSRGKGPLNQPLAWNLNAKESTDAMQPVLCDVVIGKVAVDIGNTGGPVHIQVFGNDKAADVAADFCSTYGKYSAHAKAVLTEAVTRSIQLTEQCVEERDNDDAWVLVPEVQQVTVDLRREY